MLADERAQLDRVGLVDLLEGDARAVAAPRREVADLVVVRRRCRRSCPPRSCVRSARARRRARPSCTRSHGRRRPRRPRWRPELRTAKRSPARPRKNARPLVAPYSTVLPMITFSSATVAGVGGRAHREDPAREPLAGVVVGDAVEREGDPGREPAAEALPGRSRRSGRGSSPPRGRRRRGGARSSPESRPPTQRLVLRTGRVELRPRPPRSIASCASSISPQSSASPSTGSWSRTRRRGVPGRQRRHREQRREVEAARLPVLDGARALEQVDAADSSSSVRRPRLARIRRTSSATKWK